MEWLLYLISLVADKTFSGAQIDYELNLDPASVYQNVGSPVLPDSPALLKTIDLARCLRKYLSQDQVFQQPNTVNKRFHSVWYRGKH